MWKHWQWDVFCVWHKVWRWDCRICCRNFVAFFLFCSQAKTEPGHKMCVCLCVFVCVCVFPYVTEIHWAVKNRVSVTFPAWSYTQKWSISILLSLTRLINYQVLHHFHVCVCVCLCLWGCLCTVDGCKYEVSKKGEKKARVWFLYVFAPLHLSLIVFLYVSVHLQYVYETSQMFFLYNTQNKQQIGGSCKLQWSLRWYEWMNECNANKIKWCWNNVISIYSNSITYSKMY